MICWKGYEKMHKRVLIIVSNLEYNLTVSSTTCETHTRTLRPT